MNRNGLERLREVELIEPVLRLHRPETTSRTSFKPPAGGPRGAAGKSRPGRMQRAYDQLLTS